MTEAFPSDYAESRDRFRCAARDAGWHLSALAVDGCDPRGRSLSIDIATNSERLRGCVLLVQSGVHGVEAFAGAALQIASLRAGWRPQGPAILVHALNPYGMSWLRRTNGNNVDLNRNCLRSGEAYSGAPAGYHRLNALLNPQSAPGRDGFYLRAVWQAARVGLREATAAVAGGQYEYPRGLFFGGKTLQSEMLHYADWICRTVRGLDRLLVLDLHTGLGRHGRMSIYSELPAKPAVTARLRRVFAPWIASDPQQSDGYAIRGGVATLFLDRCPAVVTDYLTVEFGTRPLLRVLHALREENRAHFFSSDDHAALYGRRLKDALCPDSAAWRRSVERCGAALLARAGDYLEEVRDKADARP